jgi:hypothetical protein
MPPRRRRGKQSTSTTTSSTGGGGRSSAAGRNTPTTTTATATATTTITPLESTTTTTATAVDSSSGVVETTANDGSKEKEVTTTTTTTTKADNDESVLPAPPTTTTTTASTAANVGNNGTQQQQQHPQPQPPQQLVQSLVLTSEKRRGVYECDYCHSDISQQPRIRCAACYDFDLCLDCFTTTDHTAASARVKAQTHTQNELVKDGVLVLSLVDTDRGGKKNAKSSDTSGHTNNNNNNNNAAAAIAIAGGGITASTISTISVPILHDHTHGYHVCDSTRYPVFPSGRQQQQQLVQMNNSSTTTTTTTTTPANTSNSGAVFGTTGTSQRTKSSSSSSTLLLSGVATATATTSNNDNDNDVDNNNNNNNSSNNDNANDNDEDDQKMVSAGDEDDKKKNKADGGGGDDDDDDNDDDDNDDDDDLDGKAQRTYGPSQATVQTFVSEITLPEDPKLYWTAEEDLRLIDAIKTHGLGNWVDVSEAINGNGCLGKTPKRCMERYFDDFCGRYGHILPPFTIVDDDQAEQMMRMMMMMKTATTATTTTTTTRAATVVTDETVDDQETSKVKKIESNSDTIDDINTNSSEDGGASGGKNQQPSDDGDNNTNTNNTGMDSSSTTANPSEMATTATTTTPAQEEEAVRASKRRHTSTATTFRSNSSSLLSLGVPAMPNTPGRSSSSSSSSFRKKLKVVPTESIPNYDQRWPDPYMPPTHQAKLGQEVARDLSCKAETIYFKSIMGASTKEEADKIRQQWIEKIDTMVRTNTPGAPTVLPPRPDDSFHLPGSELAGFMPRRGDFDVEWENDAETSLADMEFLRSDTVADKQLKLQVLEIYVQKLDAREKRKAFVLNRHLYDYRQYVHDEQRLPVDERDLIYRMRLFERFHTPDEHKKFIHDILHAKRLRKEIAKLQMYRRIGIRSLAEAEKYELDKNRCQFHKLAQLQRGAEAKTQATTSKGSTSGGGGGGAATTTNKLGTTNSSSVLARMDSSRSGAIGGADTNTKKTTAGLAISTAAGGTTTTTTTTTASGSTLASSSSSSSQKVSIDSLWKQYKINDRKSRRRSTRTSLDDPDTVIGGGGGGDAKTEQPKDDGCSKIIEGTKDDCSNDTDKDNVKGEKNTSPNTDSRDGVTTVAMEIDPPVSSTTAVHGGENNNHSTADPLGTKLDVPSDDADATMIDANGAEEKEETEKPEDGKRGISSGSVVSVVAASAEAAVVATDIESNSISIRREKKEGDQKEAHDDNFDISNSRGIDLLSKTERGLCERLRIYPMQYLEIKKVLIHESLINGLLDKDSSVPRRKTIVKIDIEKRGNVIDFLVRAGWISRKLGNAAVGIGQE